MFDHHQKEIQFGDKTVTLETGKVARQANGAVVASMGETSVLCTVCAAPEAKEGQPFFPMSVHYQERTYAAGRIPGGFFKREARPSEKETLTSRLIDRPVRPLFPKGFLNEVQIVATVLSHDMENDPDIVAMIGCSAALTISGVPFMGPIGGARVGYIDNDYVINPTIEQLESSELNLVVAGTAQGVLMVESEAHQLNEDTMLGAVMAGWNAFQPVVNGIVEFAEMCAKEPWELAETPEAHKTLEDKLDQQFREELTQAYAIQDKQERQTAIDGVCDRAVDAMSDEDNGIAKDDIKAKFKDLEADIVRGQIIKTGQRIDDRKLDDIRPISCEVGVVPRAHGSALFTRGETQALVVTTLGTGQDEQFVDALEGEYKQGFLLHYNFPPYCVGECGFMGPPKRREIGHGKLAWRAINPLMPDAEEFPYTVRTVSEITESNGSSSMATVCGTSLSLMDSGVPVPKPIAGIAMGLIKEKDDYAVLSDILGDEDHLGDMDFKVAGTEDGVTSLQMDIKITSITEEIMQKALEQARQGRMHILGEMEKAITTPRTQVKSNAPQIVTLSIPQDKIREVIGTGGSVIRDIVEKSGAKVDIEDDGTVKVAAPDLDAIDTAVDMINNLTQEPEVGTVYDGKVVKTVDFGAFVNFLGANDGLVHISEIADERIGQVTDKIQEGDEVKVLLIGKDDRGKIKLSMKRVDQETGEVKDDNFKQQAAG